MSCPKAVTLAQSRIGMNAYTQDPELRYKVFEGYSDCSSFVHMVFKKAYGIYVGVWTGEQVQNGKQIFARKTVKAGSKITEAEMAMLVPGDCLYYGYEGGNAYHVEMYIGDGKQIGHGWGTGPVISDTLSYSHSKGIWQARRFYTEEDKQVDQADNTEKSDVKFDPLYKAKIALPVRKYAGDEYDLLNSIPYLHGGELIEICDTIKDVKGKEWYFVKINGCVYGFVEKKNFVRI